MLSPGSGNTVIKSKLISRFPNAEVVDIDNENLFVDPEITDSLMGFNKQNWVFLETSKTNVISSVTSLLNSQNNRFQDQSSVNIEFVSANPTGQSSGIMAYLPFFLILAIMYFMMIRPQAKRQKEKQLMLNSLKKGDKVVTIGGIHGTVAGFKGKESNLVILKLDKNKMYLHNHEQIYRNKISIEKQKKYKNNFLYKKKLLINLNRGGKL